MKGLNHSLDFLLKHLKENRFKAEDARKPFDVDHVVLPKLQLANHEEFIGLVDILIEDGNAIKISEPKMERLDYYKNRILITPKGLHFINRGGYTWRGIWDAIKNTAAVLNIVALLIIGFGQWMASRQDDSTKVPSQIILKEEQDSKRMQETVLTVDSVTSKTFNDSSKTKSEP
jgi:hypothetical protein